MAYLRFPLRRKTAERERVMRRQRYQCDGLAVAGGGNSFVGLLLGACRLWMSAADRSHRLSVNRVRGWLHRHIHDGGDGRTRTEAAPFASPEHRDGEVAGWTHRDHSDYPVPAGNVDIFGNVGSTCGYFGECRPHPAWLLLAAHAYRLALSRLSTRSPMKTAGLFSYLLIERT